MYIYNLCLVPGVFPCNKHRSTTWRLLQTRTFPTPSLYHHIYPDAVTPSCKTCHAHIWTRLFGHTRSTTRHQTQHQSYIQKHHARAVGGHAPQWMPGGSNLGCPAGWRRCQDLRSGRRLRNVGSGENSLPAHPLPWPQQGLWIKFLSLSFNMYIVKVLAIFKEKESRHRCVIIDQFQCYLSFEKDWRKLLPVV